ncbi:hypothetical protein SSS_06664 [Sarcoptes scabiei]|uniref:Uncharacterized protein n=1 Tax=Sarcoptes scabiei TaxID=52283 RepID=A0A834VEP2_SARSC|nr:hypothetical protein SSS_06664 [Sarcoptes scabiei]
MNIFRRLTSFASNAWNDLTDSSGSRILDDEFDNQNLDEDFVRRKYSSLPFLRKKRVNHFENQNIHCVDDPRSPTNDFIRTPILIESFRPEQVLSPFNVKDMLETIESAIECTESVCQAETPELGIECTEETLAKIEAPDVAINKSNDVEKIEETQKEVELLKIDDICDWNNVVYNEKSLTESLIVELSSTEYNSSDSKSSEEKLNDENNCKIVGYTVKNAEKSTGNFAFSTPKKNSLDSVHCGKTNRTPLMTISNSPHTNKMNFNSSDKKQIRKIKSAKPKRFHNSNRKLPKTPLTPMNAFHNHPKRQNLIDFDKENF